MCPVRTVTYVSGRSRLFGVRSARYELEQIDLKLADRHAAKTIRSNDHTGMPTLPNALNGHQPDLFQRLVIQLAASSLHAESLT